MNTGIEVIDGQHKKIVEYVNQLEDAMSRGGKRKPIENAIVKLVNYTVSHFAFEESIQEKAQYPFLRAHKRVHDVLVKRITDFQARFGLGEEVAGELHKLMSTWLLNHIRYDDMDYVASVGSNWEQHCRDAFQDQFSESRNGIFWRTVQLITPGKSMLSMFPR
ncbi:MAG: bacteriohemerythrin [Gallionella sp.]